jgi:hypothetical protein
MDLSLSKYTFTEWYSGTGTIAFHPSPFQEHISQHRYVCHGKQKTTSTCTPLGKKTGCRSHYILYFSELFLCFKAVTCLPSPAPHLETKRAIFVHRVWSLMINTSVRGLKRADACNNTCTKGFYRAISPSCRIFNSNYFPVRPKGQEISQK